MRALSILLIIAACEGPGGPAGAPGADGADGQNGTMGDPGTPANPSPWVVGSGVDIKVTALTVAATGATIAFTLKDGAGVPLDRTGHLTTAKVNVAFVLAQLAENADGSPAQYTAFTTNAAAQAATEAVEANFATVDVTAGTYTYKLEAPLTGVDLTKTQTVLAVADRTFNGARTFDRETFSVRTSGPAPIARELVTDMSCGRCHGTSLVTHGGRYNSPTQCVLCHQPQSIDPESGNTVDFKVMIHKIHRGDTLPSVKAGTPYQIIGFGGSVSDFSTVGFPGHTTDPNENIKRCTACHAGAQADRWQTSVSKAACTSCHDTTVFTAAEVTGSKILHSGGEQLTETNCAVCHGPASVIAPVLPEHYTGLLTPGGTTISIELQSMTNTAPGQQPTLTFRVLVNAAPRNILTSPLTSLTATVAGPTTDFANYWQAKIQAASGAIGTLAAVDAPNGVFSYTFPAAGCTYPTSSPAPQPTSGSCAIPATATGSFQIGVEATLQPLPTDPRWAAETPVMAFAVTDPVAVPRRTIVSDTTCNGCHYDLAFHGGGRKNPNYCVECHNPNNANDERVARFEGSTVLAEPVDFRVMIHKIHMGEDLTQPYIVGGNPTPTIANPLGSPTNFGETRYPRVKTDCAACHTGKTWTLPMDRSTKYLPTTSLEMTCSEPLATDTNAYCDNPFWTISRTTQTPPEASVCTSCHDSPATAAHAMTNTTTTGLEACAACHSAGKTFDVALFHGLP